jgi:DNA-directed RNA polymerase subunit H (RpoH/RPB5)
MYDIKGIENMVLLDLDESFEYATINKYIESELCTRKKDSFIITIDKSKDIQKMWYKISPEYHKYIFSVSELEYTILNNDLVPTHRHITEQEYKLIEQYKDRLPKILTYDPVVRRHRFSLGDIIAIIPKNGKDKHAQFRIVSKK